MIDVNCYFSFYFSRRALPPFSTFLPKRPFLERGPTQSLNGRRHPKRGCSDTNLSTTVVTSSHTRPNKTLLHCFVGPEPQEDGPGVVVVLLHVHYSKAREAERWVLESALPSTIFPFEMCEEVDAVQPEFNRFYIKALFTKEALSAFRKQPPQWLKSVESWETRMV